MKKSLKVNPNPCDTCPYRKDTPLGIWHRSEYEKLPAWDEPYCYPGMFLCHNGGDEKNTICRGWMEVHEANLGVRLLTRTKVEFNEHNNQPTKIPLYASGKEAMEAGIKGIRRPSRKAKEKVSKLLKKGDFKIG